LRRFGAVAHFLAAQATAGDNGPMKRLDLVYRDRRTVGDRRRVNHPSRRLLVGEQVVFDRNERDVLGAVDRRLGRRRRRDRVCVMDDTGQRRLSR
jgi:hypothetical protein